MKTFKFSVNTHGTNKDWDFKALSSRFEDKLGTVDDVLSHVRQGHALNAGLFGGQWRCKANVIGSQLALLDIDNSDVVRDEDGKPIKDEDGKTTKIYSHQLTLDEAIAHPFIKQYAAFIYTTASHTPDWPKFRIGFVLPELVTDTDEYESLVRHLMELLPHDPACKDASRVFYGSTGATFPLVNDDVTLPEEWVQQARTAAAAAKAERQQQVAEAEQRRAKFQEQTRVEGWDVDALIDQALGFIPPRQPGSNNYDECRSVLMALVDHYGAVEAEAIAERWSPSIKGSTWNIPRKIASFRRSGVTVGTLFHIAKVYGFRFPKRSSPDKMGDRPLRVTFRPQPPAGATVAGGEASWAGCCAIALDQEQERVELAQDSEQITADVLALVDQQLVQMRKHELIASSYQTAPPLEQRDNTLDDVVIVNDQEAGYRQAIAAGAKLIVNVTSTGGNKTGFIAHSSPQNFGASKLISVTPDLLNAESFNPEFERWEMLQGGHHGVILKDGKRYRATVETPESEKIAPGNCGKATAIQIYASKNPANPQLPCITCILLPRCQKGEGSDHGRRYQAQQAWQKSRILTNYGRLRGIGMGEEIDNLANCVLHLDESSSNVKTTKPLVVSEKNLNQTIAELSLEEPQLHQQLLPLLRWLKDRRYQEMPGYHRHHGITLAEIVDELRSHIPDDLDWAALSRFEDGHNELAVFGVSKAKLSEPEKRRLKTLSSKREATKAKAKRVAELELKEDQKHEAHLFKKVKGAKGFRQLFGLDGLSKEERQELRGLKKQILTQEEAAELADLQTRYEASKSSNLSVGETALKAKEIRLRWLGEFIGIIQGDVPGHARIAHGEIVVTIQDNAHLNAIHAAKLTSLTDASELRTKQALSDKYGIPADQIFILEVGQPRHRNSKLIQITGLGKMGRQRGQGLEECKSALVAALKERDPSHVHFDQNGFSHDARLFADSIGSNDYKNCTSLSATPPRPSINGLLDEFCTRRGIIVSKDDPVFQEFYNHRYAELIRQWEGRSRANLKPDVPHIHYIFTDDLLPITPDQVIPAYEICPAAARKGQRTIIALVEVAKGLLDQGKNLTQTALAIASKLQGLNNGQGYTQQYISKIFLAIKWQVQLFLKGSYKKSCRTPEELERLLEKASALGQVSQYFQGESPATQVADLIQWMLDEIKLSDLPWVLELVGETSRGGILGVLAAVFFPDLAPKWRTCNLGSIKAGGIVT